MRKEGFKMEVNNDLLLTDHTKMKQYLEEKYESVIQKYTSEKQSTNKDIPNIIWICWWQGLDTAPEIVKLCFKTIKKFAGEREVILITKDNYQDYVDIPNYIIQKMETGILSITHFSDVLRVNLLSKYGGIWIDSTCLLTANIFEDLIPEFYTVKLPHNEKEICVSDGKWCIFFMCSSKNNILFNFLKDFYNAYWKEENTLIAYFLTDYAISIAYDKIDEVKRMIDNVPENNVRIHQLKEMLNNEFDMVEYNNILEQNKIHKLAHERKYVKSLENGKETFYGHLLK